MMRWKKRLFCLLAVLGVCAALFVPALAEERFVYDGAGLLTDPERDALESRAAELWGEYDCAVYIVTVSDYRDYGGTVEAVAESMLDENGFGPGAEGSGVLLLLSMEDRDFALTVCGYAETALSGYGRARLEEEFLDDFRRDDWYGGFADYVSSCGRMLEQAGDGEPSDSRYTPSVNGDVHPSFFRGLRERLGPFGLIIVIVVFPALIALIVCTIAKRNMKSVKKAEKADFFAVPGSMELYASEDRFTHITQTRVKVESDSDHNHNRSGGGGGGGFSTSSGKF